MTKKHGDSDWVNKLLWGIYILLLGVLLPHTAWMFSRAERDNYIGIGIAWAAALVFELVIAAMTHKLSRHISNTPKYNDTWKRYKARYGNAYGAGLGLAWVVSTYANLAHAVEFGQPIKIFDAWGWPVWTYSVAFGAILPTASLLFAWVLSSVIEQDASESTEPEIIQSLKEKIRLLERERTEANQRVEEAEARFRAAGDIFARLVSESRRDRILAASERWPALPDKYIAVITETSPSYVSEVKNGGEE